MAENNEEQYLDELLNSLRSSNTSGENDVEQDSEQDSEKSAVDTDIVLDDGTEVIDNAGAENGLYDDIGPIIDEPQTDDIGPIIDESPADEEVPPANGRPQTEDEPVNEAPSAGDEADENTSGESSSDDIFALEDNFDISDENDESAAGTDEENQPDDVPLTLTEPDDAQPENTTESIGQDDSDDDSDDGLMQLLNQINGEDGKHEEKPDNAAGADKSHNETKAKDAKSDKAAREEEKERKKAESLLRKSSAGKKKKKKRRIKKIRQITMHLNRLMSLPLIPALIRHHRRILI